MQQAGNTPEQISAYLDYDILSKKHDPDGEVACMFGRASWADKVQKVDIDPQPSVSKSY